MCVCINTYTGTPEDAMHTLLEGVLAWDIRAAVDFIQKSNNKSVNLENAVAESAKTIFNFENWKNPPFLHSGLKKGSVDVGLGMGAVQTLHTAVALPFVLHSIGVDPEIPIVKVFLLSNRITHLCLLRYSSASLSAEVERLLVQHDVLLAKSIESKKNKNKKGQNEDFSYRPKNHFATKHIPECIRRFGSCRGYWCMKPEGKHYKLKRKSAQSENWKNPCKDMMRYMLRDISRNSSDIDQSTTFADLRNIHYGGYSEIVVNANDYAFPALQIATSRLGKADTAYFRIHHFRSKEGVIIKPDSRVDLPAYYRNKTVMRIMGSTSSDIRYLSVIDIFAAKGLHPTDPNLEDNVILTGYMWKLVDKPFNLSLCANQACWGGDEIYGLFVSEVDTQEVCHICQPIGLDGFENPFYVVDRGFDPCVLEEGMEC
eukprot:Rmarinus@m.11759